MRNALKNDKLAYILPYYGLSKWYYHNPKQKSTNVRDVVLDTLIGGVMTCYNIAFPIALFYGLGQLIV